MREETFMPMFRRLPTIVCANPECENPRFQPDELYFVCPRRKVCKGNKRQDAIPPKVRAAWMQDTLFRPTRYRYAVTCPDCGSSAYLKVCPYCGEQQPVATGNANTIAVIGATSSGKTCYITALIKQLFEELTKRARLGAAAEWDDDEGRVFYQTMRGKIFDDCKLPQQTQKETRMKTIQITARVPKRRWSRGVGVALRKLSGARLGRTSRNVSLVIPDPSGELLEQLKETYYVNYLAQAKALILMVDPFASASYRKRLQGEGVQMKDSKGLFERKGMDPADVLNNVAAAIRNELTANSGVSPKQIDVLPQQLAVVLTKCDEKFILDPGDPRFRQAKQGRTYNLNIAYEMSERVRDFMESELGFAGVGAAADASFSRSCFFAASALGTPPIQVGEEPDPEGGDPIPIFEVRNPMPRYVEDPFLWILREWKYI